MTPYREVRSPEDLEQAVVELGLPAVLKTAAFGYDGKGQFLIRSQDQLAEAWSAIGRQEAVLEAFIDFEREISVVAARGEDGQFVHYGAIENQHSRHILDVSSAPACVSSKVAQEAVDLARCVLEKLEVV